MNGVKGSCGLCGGRVVGFIGSWLSIPPPPPGKCEKCGAEEAAHGPVLEMVPVYPRTRPIQTSASPWTAGMPEIRTSQTSDCGCNGGCKAWGCPNL